MRSCLSYVLVGQLFCIHKILIGISLIVFTSGCGGSQAGKSASPTSSDAVDSSPTTPESSAAKPTMEYGAAPPVAKTEQPHAEVESNIATPSAATVESPIASAPAATPAKPPEIEKPAVEQIARWAVPEFEPFRLLACYDGVDERALLCMAIAPNGKQFVTGGSHLLLWNTTDPKPVVNLLADHEQKYKLPITSVAISADGKWLASGDSDGHLGIWNVEKQSEVVMIEVCQGDVTQVAFSPNTEQIATTNYSGEVKLWQTSDGKLIKSMPLAEREIKRMIFVSDTLLAGVGANAIVWNLENGEQASVLSSARLMGTALAISPDKRQLAFSDASGVGVRDIQKSSMTDVVLRGHSESIELVDFSSDGKWIATFAGSSIWIWEATTGKSVQVIDADGGVTTDLKWMPNCNLLAITSLGGRVRIWGTVDVANSAGLQPVALPTIEPIAAESRKPANWAQLQRVIDLPSFPKLAGAVPGYGFVNRVNYSANCALAEARQFYRYFLGEAGWIEVENKTNEEGLLFNKDNCQLKVGLSESSEGNSSKNGSLKVELFFAGNYKLQWLPKYPEIQANSSHEYISSSGYQVKADITDLEVALLRAYHAAGWVAWTRLAVSSSEDEPESRSLDFVQGASQLSVFIGPVANTPDVISVQTSVNSLNKLIPVPADVSWIECDFSTDLKLAARTKLGLEELQMFFDQSMASEGWLARDDGRGVRDGQAWLPFVRGQQDVTIRLVAAKDGLTNIFVGDGERWQHSKEEVKVDPELAAAGIEAADFPLPKDAEKINYSANDQRVSYVLPGTKPTAAVELLASELIRLDWVRGERGVLSDEYVLANFTKGKATIEFRATLRENLFSDVGISGDGLLWQKPLPVPQKRISYETWMTKNRVDFSLDHLDKFSSEIRNIPIVRTGQQ